jgi:hypothetical protein
MKFIITSVSFTQNGTSAAFPSSGTSRAKDDYTIRFMCMDKATGTEFNLDIQLADCSNVQGNGCVFDIDMSHMYPRMEKLRAHVCKQDVDEWCDRKGLVEASKSK